MIKFNRKPEVNFKNKHGKVQSGKFKKRQKNTNQQGTLILIGVEVRENKPKHTVIELN